jgi:hypothetical protein
LPLSIITWNTQGTPLGDAEKKQTLSALSRTYDVVLLQECGAFVQESKFEGKNVIGFEQAGAFNIRCSTAIVAPGWDNSGAWTGSSSGRPGLWIDIGGRIVGTIHCTSGGVGMTDLTPFMLYMAGKHGGRTLIIGGDFNCVVPDGTTQLNAGTSTRPVAFDFLSQGRATHSGGQTLDHFVSQNATLSSGPRRFTTKVSDHDAVSATFA